MLTQQLYCFHSTGGTLFVYLAIPLKYTIYPEIRERADLVIFLSTLKEKKETDNLPKIHEKRSLLNFDVWEHEERDTLYIDAKFEIRRRGRGGRGRATQSRDSIGRARTGHRRESKREVESTYRFYVDDAAVIDIVRARSVSLSSSLRASLHLASSLPPPLSLFGFSFL